MVLRRLGVVSALALMASLSTTTAGCITRPVSNQDPETKTSFTSTLRQAAIDKIDLLFAIDDSGSMGDKQELLSQAVPDLLARLLTPDCLAEDGTVVGASTIDPKTGSAACPAGAKPEFPPVHDLHIGIVSSSIGGIGGDLCTGAHDDDRAHLLNRPASSGGTNANAAPSNFLAWLPTVDANQSKARDPRIVGATPYTQDAQARMVQDFQDLIVGVREDGCGFEAQLESMYRFLVQPDPYDHVSKDANGLLRFEGVDGELLKQRHDFLRPDSLLAVVMITDENESTIDPTALGGQAWRFESSDRLAPGTSACATNANDPACDSCFFAKNASDPKCQSTPRMSAADDPINLRFYRMKQRFGVDPRYPISRYVRGFTEAHVPSRDNADPEACTNPIFAATLPAGAPGEDPCRLPLGPRTKDLVYFALIGGVPWQLLTTTPDDLSASYAGRQFKAQLDAQDWTRLLGADPAHYDRTGQHYLMQESADPREGAHADQAHDREWATGGVDLQYACTFELPHPKDCSDPASDNRCDCAKDTDSPLCDPTNKRTQLRGKAYPTLNELQVAKELADRAIVASICPPDPQKKDLGGKPNPFYGYRPAVRAIVDRLAETIGEQCLPEELVADDEGRVPCLALEWFAEPVRCADKGLQEADPAIASRFRTEQQAELGKDVAIATVCEAPQLLRAQFVGDSCEDSAQAGWCYVTGKPAGRHCSQAIKFSTKGYPAGARVALQCIKSSVKPAK